MDPVKIWYNRDSETFTTVPQDPQEGWEAADLYNPDDIPLELIDGDHDELWGINDKNDFMVVKASDDYDADTRRLERAFGYGLCGCNLYSYIQAV